MTNHPQRTALVVGLGISGISAAIALKQAGWEPKIVEKAPARRRGGYFIALFKMGRIAAEHLGALDGLHDRGSAAAKNFAIARTGITGPMIGFADAPKSFMPWMMLRGDVEQAVFDTLPGDVEIRYNTRPVDVTQDGQSVQVTLEDSATGTQSVRMYDLLVGADGVHSQIREMVFGPAERFTVPLDCMVCAFELPENPPGLKPIQGVIMREVGRSFWVFPFDDHAATVLFTYAADDPQSERKKDARQRVREIFGPAPYGKYMGYALDQLEQADESIFDTTDQIKMDTWHTGRVMLLGDAAWCPTLYSGMGATTEIAGADLLGAALRRHPDDLDTALTEWERVLRPKLTAFQKQGASMGRKTFLAITQRELDARNRSMPLRMKVISNRLIGKILPHVPMIKARNTDLTTLL